MRHIIIRFALAVTGIAGLGSPGVAERPDPIFPASACGPLSAPTQARLDALLRVVRAGNVPAIRTAVQQNWALEGKQASVGAQTDLVRWARASNALAPLRVCTTPDDNVFGEYRNALTGAVDRFSLTLDKTPDRRIVALNLREGFRIDPAGAATDGQRIARLDTFLRDWSARDLFSGVVLIARQGKPIYWKAFGEADREAHRPFTLDTPVNLASMNKLFTATAVMQSVERGVLRLDQNVNAAAPGTIAGAHGDRISIAHLLSHTSGLSDAADREHPAAPPGQVQRYANLNFAILGDLIAHATGMRYEDYMRLAVFGPAGMAQTSRYEMARPSDRLAIGYTAALRGDDLVLVPNPLLHTIPGGAMGGYFSTAGDLLRFANALQAGKLVSLASLKQMRAVHDELGAQDYGYGVIRWRGPGIWGNAGDLPGTDADLEIYGDTGYTAIVLANRSNVNPPVLAKIRSLFFPRGATGPSR